MAELIRMILITVSGNKGYLRHSADNSQRDIRNQEEQDIACLVQDEPGQIDRVKSLDGDAEPFVYQSMKPTVQSQARKPP